MYYASSEGINSKHTYGGTCVCLTLIGENCCGEVLELAKSGQSN